MNESNLPSSELNPPPSEPTPPPAGYNLQQNLVYMFKDANWLSKILVGALVSLVPILNFASYGYAVQTTRNIRDDEATPLPGWSGSIGKFFGEGLKLFVIGLLYSIPLWILSLILIPIFTSDSGALVALGVLIALAELAVALLLIFWFQGVIVNFANLGTIGSGFQFGKIWASSGRTWAACWSRSAWPSLRASWCLSSAASWGSSRASAGSRPGWSPSPPCSTSCLSLPTTAATSRSQAEFSHPGG